MSSRRKGVVMLAAMVLAACGHKEAPKPPPSKVPAPINDLEVQQRGQEVILTMSYPSVTLGGLPIEELQAVEIWTMSRILSGFGAEVETVVDPEAAPTEDEEAIEPGLDEAIEDEATEEAEEPESSLFSLPTTTVETEDEEDKEKLIDVRGRDFAAVAKNTYTRKGEEIDSAVIGDQLVFRLSLEDLITGEEVEEVLVFGARSVGDKRRASPFSNLVKLFPRTPPPAPANFSVEARPDGIQLDWEEVDEALGYRVYRRDARVRDYSEPIYKAREGLASYLDREALFGNRYIYTVTSVGNLDPVVESAIAAEHEVNYKDRFPPAAPTDLVALPETGRVRLIWQASASTDTQGYWIYRQDPGQDFAVIHEELIVGSEFLDRDVRSGQLYRYYLVAVDSKDNRSEASVEIEVRVP